MKKINFVLALLFLGCQPNAFCQADTAIHTFDVNGMKVIVKPAANEVISAQLFITGGVNNYTADNQGVAQLMLLTMADGGSQHYPKDEYQNITEREGIEISGRAGYDHSRLSLRTLVQNWDKALDIFCDIALNPAWNAQSFQLMQNRMIAGLKQMEANPDSHLRDITISGTFKGKSYEKNPEGTPASIKALTLEEVKKQYQDVFKTKRLLLVVVGNVSPQALQKKLAATFGTLPQGTAYVYNNQPVVVTTPSFYAEQRQIATNYITGVMSAPTRGTDEAVALRVGMSMLYDRLFVEVRTKRNLSYAPSASVSRLFSPYSYIYVTTTKPDTTVEVMTDVIRNIRKDGFTQKELTDKKAGYLTDYYEAQQSNAAQALTLGIAELIKNWQYALQVKDKIENLTLQEVDNAFDKYANAISWFYLGNENQAHQDVFMKKL